MPDAMHGGTLVLVVDEHAADRELLEKQLQALGYTAEGARGGVEALEKWRACEYGLVLTGCDMHGLDGYTLARTIRAEEAAGARERVPVIACTAAEDAARCRQAGMSDHLAKPVGLPDLREKLDWWLPLPDDGAHARLPALENAAQALDLADAKDKWQDPARLKQLLEQFLESMSEDTCRLREGIDAGDAAQVRATAHRMLGAALMVGAHGCIRALEELKDGVRCGDWPRSNSALLALLQESARIGKQVRAL